METKTFIIQNLEECKRRMYRTLRGLSAEEIVWQPNPEANAIGFMLWHVARVEDRWMHRYAQESVEVWLRGGWHTRLNLPEIDTGVNYTADQVATFPRLAVDDLQGYFDAVRQETLAYLQRIDPSELDIHPGRIAFPEVSAQPLPDDFTIARMFRQLIGEENQHLGQMAYIRGLQRGLNQ